MASEKQIAANRLNSQKSTGPRTVAGKSVSRMNALQSVEEKWRFKVLYREHPLSDTFTCLEQRLSRLQSRLNALERSNRAALKELRELQAAETEAASDEIGFVPSNPEPASPVEQAFSLPSRLSSRDVSAMPDN